MKKMYVAPKGYGDGSLNSPCSLEKAKELKKNLMAGTGLAVYIEFEGGMYKVRVGDFLSREEASQARETLLKEYPDCWIVSATIRK